jgi:hypothetical protein
MVVYIPHAQRQFGGMYLVTRASVDPATLAGSLVREAHAIDPDAPVFESAPWPIASTIPWHASASP